MFTVQGFRVALCSGLAKCVYSPAACQGHGNFSLSPNIVRSLLLSAFSYLPSPIPMLVSGAVVIHKCLHVSVVGVQLLLL